MSGTMNIEYNTQIWREGNQYIAHAMPLDVLSAGPSPEEARKALDEAVHLFLFTAADMGTLEDVLQEEVTNSLGFPIRSQEGYVFAGPK
jgi:hypothetical protein